MACPGAPWLALFLFFGQPPSRLPPGPLGRSPPWKNSLAAATHRSGGGGNFSRPRRPRKLPPPPLDFIQKCLTASPRSANPPILSQQPFLGHGPKHVGRGIYSIHWCSFEEDREKGCCPQLARVIEKLKYINLTNTTRSYMNDGIISYWSEQLKTKKKSNNEYHRKYVPDASYIFLEKKKRQSRWWW